MRIIHAGHGRQHVLVIDQHPLAQRLLADLALRITVLQYGYPRMIFANLLAALTRSDEHRLHERRLIDYDDIIRIVHVVIVVIRNGQQSHFERRFARNDGLCRCNGIVNNS